jgi:hypothetical protein
VTDCVFCRIVARQSQADVEYEDEEPPEPGPFDRPGDWYVVHTYAGYENKVKQNLASRVRSMAVGAFWRPARSARPKVVGRRRFSRATCGAGASRRLHVRHFPAGGV